MVLVSPPARRLWVWAWVLGGLCVIGFVFGWLIQGRLGAVQPLPKPDTRVFAASSGPKTFPLEPDAQWDHPPVTSAREVELRLTSEPPVEVHLRQRRLGRTPLVVRLPPGPVTLILRNREQNLEARRSLELEGEVMARRLQFTRNASVGFRLQADFRIELDGRFVGTSPLPPFWVFEGEHHVTATDPKTGRRWSARFGVAAGETRWVSF